MADDKVEIVVLDCGFSMFGMRARIALAGKGVQYKRLEQDLTNKSPLLLQMNPIQKMIPVLIHNGKPICESLIIVEYIDQVWNHTAPLLPPDRYLRARARFWANFVDLKVYGASRRIWNSNGEEQVKGKNEFIESLSQMEEELGNKVYFGGDMFGFVDVALIPFYCWFYTYETFGNFKIEEECPKLIAWAKRCKMRESVSKSLGDEKQVYESVLAYKKSSRLA
ncbi:glutathione S-transferase U19-like [Prosopis cineraria]|uniref:glutathione S-transferase U19-like n=1 Tax=Prosopis cineraria TaxID=364024 RepID=UPI00240FA0E9|nr:glutathione S-transferase U19-like [Prosopis cineraria]